ncbi:MAG: sigma 54-interacting transcriptional regulator, partial [Planctomycetota bacterium]|nr:sigma 54-interacting transcriptional regulator [Planctomycetota bacterium]
GVLQDRSIRRLGSERTIPIDVRVMAATNRDLRDAVKDGSFRSDLFYRLSVVTLDIPPLRKHPEDVAGLVLRYLEEFRVRLDRNVTEISDEAMVALRDYSWPGNIRELINVIERAVLLCEGSTITLRDLPFELVHSVSEVTGDSLTGIDLQLSEAWLERPWKPVRSATMAQAELTYLHEHLVDARGDLSEVADRSGLNPRTLFDMMQRHGLKKESFKSSRRPRD